MPAQPKPPPNKDFNKVPILETVAGADGGINSYIEPYYLEESQIAYLKNADLDVPGLRKKRLGCFPMGGGSASTPGGMGSFRTSDGARQLQCVWGELLYQSPGTYLWYDVVGPTATPLSLVPSLYNIVQGEMYWATNSSDVTTLNHATFLNGTQAWTGVTLPALYMVCENGETTNNSSLCPKAMAWWQGRLWLGNLTSDDFNANTLMWSNLWDGGTVNTSNNIVIDAAFGDEIMAIVPTRKVDPRIYIFKKKKIYALDVVWGTGVYVPATENTLDTQNSRLSLVSTDVGCVAPKTVVYTSGSADSDVYFLSDDGFRSLRRVEQDVAGGAGEPVSGPVQDVIDRINWASVENAVAAVYDQKIFLCLPVDGSTLNNTTLVFDLIKKIWVSEYTWGPRDLVTWNFADEKTKLYMQWPYETTETLTGLGATSAAHVFQALASDTYYDPSLTSIEYEEQTKAFVFGDFGAMKRWDYLELMLEPATTDSTLSMFVKVDEMDWQLLEDVSVQPVYQYPVLPARLPWDLSQAGSQLVRLHGLHDAPPGRRIQYKFTTDSPTTMGIRLLRTRAWHYPEQWE